MFVTIPESSSEYRPLEHNYRKKYLQRWFNTLLDKELCVLEWGCVFKVEFGWV